MELEDIIQTLGLNDKEARVYLALLQKGASSAYSIAVKSDLKRPTAYFVLDELVKRGVASLIPRSKKKLYRATPPEDLIEKAEENLKKVKEKLPELKALSDTGIEKPHVSYLEGIEGIREIYHYKLNEMEGQTIRGFYASAPIEVQEQLDYFDSYHKKRKRLNIVARGIVPDDPENLSRYRETDKEYLREMKILPKKVYSSNISIEIGDTWVKTSDFNNLQGLIIENPEFAKTMTEIFDLVWSNTG